MSAPAISDRTVLRDAVLAAFAQRQGAEGMREKAFDVSPSWLTAEECKRFPTYCVVVTNESPLAQTMQRDDCSMTVVIVIYAKDAADPRAKLDAALEDAYETMLLVQATIKSVVWKMKLDELTTDEGTTIAKPHAQAVQRWQCHHQRRAIAV